MYIPQFLPAGAQNDITIVPSSGRVASTFSGGTGGSAQRVSNSLMQILPVVAQGNVEGVSTNAAMLAEPHLPSSPLSVHLDNTVSNGRKPVELIITHDCKCAHVALLCSQPLHLLLTWLCSGPLSDGGRGGAAAAESLELVDDDVLLSTQVGANWVMMLTAGVDWDCGTCRMVSKFSWKRGTRRWCAGNVLAAGEQLHDDVLELEPRWGDVEQIESSADGVLGAVQVPWDLIRHGMDFLRQRCRHPLVVGAE